MTCYISGFSETVDPGDIEENIGLGPSGDGNVDSLLDDMIKKAPRDIMMVSNIAIKFNVVGTYVLACVNDRTGNNIVIMLNNEVSVRDDILLTAKMLFENTGVTDALTLLVNAAELVIGRPD
jgi:hypothetical protein